MSIKRNRKKRKTEIKLDGQGNSRFEIGDWKTKTGNRKIRMKISENFKV